MLIDADPQGNATSGVGVDPRTIKGGLYECTIQQSNAKPYILKTDTPHLDVLPTNADLAGLEIELVNLNQREQMMKRVLQPLKDEYDFIIMDCCPSLGLIVINSLCAADSVLIPVQCEYFALEGMGQLLQTVKFVQTHLNTQLDIEGVLLTMFDGRLRLANQVVEEVKMHFQDMVFDTIIQRLTKLAEAPSFGKTIIMHDASGKGSTNYLNLARELLQRNGLTKFTTRGKSKPEPPEELNENGI